MRLELRGQIFISRWSNPARLPAAFATNAYQAYQAHIDKTHSAHRDYYERVERRLGGTKPCPSPAARGVLEKSSTHWNRTSRSCVTP